METYVYPVFFLVNACMLRCTPLRAYQEGDQSWRRAALGLYRSEQSDRVRIPSQATTRIVRFRMRLSNLRQTIDRSRKRSDADAKKSYRKLVGVVQVVQGVLPNQDVNELEGFLKEVRGYRTNEKHPLINMILNR